MEKFNFTEFEVFLDSFREPINVVDKECNILWINSSTKDLFGAKIIGQKCSVICTNGREKCDNCPVEETINDGKEHSKKVEIKVKGARYNFVCQSSVANFDKSNKPKHILQRLSNLFIGKQDEFSAIHSEELIDNIQLGMYVYHLEDIDDDRSLRMIAANQASEHLTGVTVKEVVGRTLDENFPGLRDKGIPQAYARVVRQQETIEIEDIYYSDNRVISGAFSVKAFPLSGNKVGVAFENITERKKRELELKQKTKEIESQADKYLTIYEELKDSYEKIQEINTKLSEREAYLNSLFKVAPIGIGVVIDQKFTFVNDLMCKITGYTKEDLIGEDSRLIYLDEKEYEYVRKEKYNQVKFGGIGTVETRWKNKYGEIKSILLSTSPIDPEDFSKGITFAALDITKRKITEQKLQQSKLMLQTVLDAIPARVFWKDSNSYYLGCNKRFADDAGLKSPESILGKTDFDLIWKEDAHRFVKTDFEVINSGISLMNYEETQKIKGEINRWLKKTKIPFRGIDGKIIGVLGTYEDITRGKRAREKLREREQTIKSIEEGISSKTGEKFFETIILKLGRTLKADYTYIGQLVGDQKDKVKTLSICYRGRMMKNIEFKLKNTPTEQGIDHEVRYAKNVAKKFPKDKFLKEQSIEGYIGVPLYDNNNSTVGVMVSLFKQPVKDARFCETVLKIFSTRAGTEIERLKTEKALRESEERLTSIVENAPVIMMLVNENRSVVKLNKTGLIATSKSSEQIEGELIGSVLNCINSIKNPKGCGYGIRCKNCIMKQVLLDSFAYKKDYYKIEIILPINFNGIITNHTVLLSTTYLKDMVPNTLLVTIDDITERKNIENELKKAKEKAEESDKLKSAFLANMSHEIRTPLNGILGFSALFNNDNITSDKRKKYIDIINTSSDQLLAIINDIIEISKIEASQIKIHYRKTNLNAIMDALYDQYQMEKKLKNKEAVEIVLTKELENANSNILIDDIRLKQVLINLLSNAFKFTSKGKIEFGYRIEQKDILFWVKDSGIGISKGKQQIIFERFRQADEKQTRKFGGTGLGLAISKALTTLLDGKIWVESKKWKGASFYFTIPYRPVNEIPEAFENASTLQSRYNWKGKKILIVEDTEHARIYLEEILTSTNATFIVASNGKQAIELCKANKDIDLILMDIQLPDIGGYEATVAIRKFRPDVSIIAQTAYGMAGDREKALNAGCDAYISKPINKDILLSKINAFFARVR